MIFFKRTDSLAKDIRTILEVEKTSEFEDLAFYHLTDDYSSPHTHAC